MHCRRTYPVAANGELGTHINFAMRTRFVADIDKTKTKLALRKRRTFSWRISPRCCLQSPNKFSMRLRIV